VAAVRDIVLADRKGNIEPLKLASGPYDTPRVSPDGTQIAFSTDDGKEQAIWIYDVASAAAPRRLTFSGNNRFPLWSSDGRRVAFQSDRERDLAIFWQLADGTTPAERLTTPEKGGSHTPESWMRNSGTFLFRVATQQNKFDLWTMSTQDKKAWPFAEVHSVNPPNAVFSPDGHWVAYYSDESGEDALWLKPFPSTEVRYQLATDGDSHHPMWSPDGRELLYVPGANLISARIITTRPAFSFSNPTQVPVGRIVMGPPPNHRPFDITREGKFVALRNAASGTPTTPQIHVVLNWFEELKRLVPTN
jgi:Tol biopolymer transport system component